MEGTGCLLLFWMLQKMVAAAFCFQWELMQIGAAVLIHVGEGSPGGLKQHKERTSLNLLHVMWLSCKMKVSAV